jgi:predicted phage terminase large subunit-like protein
VEGGNIVRREWWKYYDRRDIPAFATTLISVDAAFKDADDNDFVAIEVWSKLGNNYYLRYLVNQHLGFPATVQMIRLMKRLFPESQYILVEDKANGSAIIQTLRSEFVGVIAVTPKGGKVSRVHAVAPAIESGNVYIPSDEAWAQELVDQFTSFPAAAHDDMVDSATQALSFMLFSNGLASVPIDDGTRALREAELREQVIFLSESMYDVYDDPDGFY